MTQEGKEPPKGSLRWFAWKARQNSQEPPKKRRRSK